MRFLICSSAAHDELQGSEQSTLDGKERKLMYIL